MEQRSQVIVVGGGPVGVALAIDLAQRGISVVVLERHDKVAQIPKGQSLMQRSLEHFYFWGCVEQLRAARLLPPGYPIGGITAYESLMSKYWYVPMSLSAVSSYFYEDNERLPQYRTEEVLRTRLSELANATLRISTDVGAIEQDEHGVKVSVTSREWPYEQEVLEADYLVGCDGARSLVRDTLGLERHIRDFDQKMVLAVFSSTELHEGLARFPERTTYRVLHPDYHGVWLFFGRVNLGETWFFHGPVPRSMTSSDTDSILAFMQKAAGFEFSCTFEHVGFWDLRIDVATTYGKGRAFIAGDECHSHPPYGGLGLNTGLDDVANLGWKLSAVLNGWGGDGLLDSYSLERQPIFEQTGNDVIAHWIDSDREFLDRYRPDRNLEEFESIWRDREDSDSAPQWYEPHYEGSSIVVGAAGRAISIHGDHQYGARPGHHLAPQPLSSGKNVFEELGREFTLLAFGADDTSVKEFVVAAESLGVPLTVVVDTYDGGRERYGARLILVRPDQYVAWSGNDTSAVPAEVLARAVGAGGH